MRGVGLVVALLSTMILSGCVGGDGAETPTETDAPEDAVVLTDADGSTRVVRPHIAAFTDHESYTHTESEDGTFSLGEHWTNNGEFLSIAGHDVGNMHVRDISDKIPVGIPVRVAVEVQAELAEGDLDVWLNLPQEEVWTFSGDAPFGGWSRLEYGIVRGGSEPVELVVFYDEVEPVQTFDYVVTYEIQAEPFVVLPGIPVSLPVGRGAASIEARFNGTDSGVLHVFDPQDRLVARVASSDGTANHTLASGAPTGDYVVMLDGAATGPAHIFVYAPAEGEPNPIPYGTVTQVIERTEGTAFGVAEGGEVSFEVARVPLQVGLQVHVETTSTGFTVSLTGPDGQLLSGDVSFDPPPPLDLAPDNNFGFTFLTRIGGEGHAVGTYTGTMEPGDVQGDGEVHGWVVTYGR